ncbi:MAG: S1 RNA-binding domain-containing protein [Phycisphaerales bacterium]|nr:S1 RNA-binding domain-containing protein [Phycisphaerales bacterium]MCB9835201.1 S1 RNA-binding domain-containing protein [Phycisphaera sp.]
MDTPTPDQQPAHDPQPAPESGKSQTHGLDAEIQGELEQAMADLEKLTGAGHPHDPQEIDQAKQAAASAPKKGLRGPRVVHAGREHRTGIVVSVGPSDLFVEFGPKELGVVDRNQWKEGEEPPKVGSELEVTVDRYEASEGLYVCSRPGAVKKADWEMLEPGQVVEARVVDVNKGGLELEIAGHRAFMPASQVSLDRIPDLSIFKGEKMTCHVQRVDRRGSGNIVLSRRQILQEQKATLQAELRDKLAEGQTVKGKVKKIMPFGAFVDIGGVDGLVHISDLAHDRVNMGEKNVARYVKEGQEVQVQVLKLNWDENRISLGLKQLQDDPFAAATEEIKEGEIVTGKVKNLADFGAFIELPGGLEGLVHVSEIDFKRINNPADVLKPDEVVSVKVLKVDPESRRISLSIKQTKEAPKREAKPGDGKGRGGPGGGGGGRGRGGKQERDDRTPEEILKETPALRRQREKAKANAKKEQGGLDMSRFGGVGLGDLKL